MANHLNIERTGGIAGFGGPGKVRSRGRVDFDALSPLDRAAIDALFEQHHGQGVARNHTPDAFRYSVSRTRGGVVETIDVPEASLPAAVVNAVTDELI
jgi:hypothetical protein